MKNKSSWIILILIHILFLGMALNFKHSNLKDSQEYIQQAINIREHASFYCGDLNQQTDPALFSKRPPFYGLMLAFIYWPFIGDYLVLIFQSLLSLFNCWMAVKLAEIIIKRNFNIKWFFFPLLFFVSQFIYANMIMSEILFQTCWLLSAYFAIKFLLKPENKDLWYHQAAITAAILTKPVAYLFPLVSASFLVLMIIRKKIPSSSFTTLILPVGVIALIMFSNYRKTNVIEYSSIQQNVLINYNMPQLLSGHMDSDHVDSTINNIENTAAQLSYPDKVRYIDQQSISLIKKYPLNYLGLHIKGFFRFFLDHGRWDIYSFVNGFSDQFPNESLKQAFNESGIQGAEKYLQKFPKSMVVYLLFAVLMNIFLLVAFMRFLFLKSIPRSIRVFLAMMVFYIAFLTGPTGASRFRVPVYPILLVTFAIVIKHSGEQLKLKSRFWFK